MKAQTVLWYAQFKSFKKVQDAFRELYGQEPPSKPSISNWTKTFKETGTVAHRKRTGMPPISAMKIEEIRQKFERSPKSSIRKACLQLGVSQSSVANVCRKNLHLFPMLVILRCVKPKTNKKNEKTKTHKNKNDNN